MKVAILCGGFGTRIRDVSDNLPKPMIPIGGHPILWHIMKYYAHWGHNDFTLCLGYKGSEIKNFFLNYRAQLSDFRIDLSGKKPLEYLESHGPLDWQITLAETGLNSMTGARVKRIEKHIIDDKDFLLTYGDGLGNVDLDRLVAFHKAHNRVLTVTGVRPPGRFGELCHRDDGMVTEFNEKPQATGGRISGGFFVCKRELFDYLDNAEDLVFEQEPMRALVRNQQLMVYEHDGFWQPMDTYRDYQYLNSIFEKGKAPWVIW